jgi:hypothetical protein
VELSFFASAAFRFSSHCSHYVFVFAGNFDSTNGTNLSKLGVN